MSVTGMIEGLLSRVADLEARLENAKLLAQVNDAQPRCGSPPAPRRCKRFAVVPLAIAVDGRQHYYDPARLPMRDVDGGHHRFGIGIG